MGPQQPARPRTSGQQVAGGHRAHLLSDEGHVGVCLQGTLQGDVTGRTSHEPDEVVVLLGGDGVQTHVACGVRGPKAREGGRAGRSMKCIGPGGDTCGGAQITSLRKYPALDNSRLPRTNQFRVRLAGGIEPERHGDVRVLEVPVNRLRASAGARSSEGRTRREGQITAQHGFRR
jgi:hypothetical protein